MATNSQVNAVVDLDYLHVEVHPELSLIVLFWKRQVNISELRTGFYTAIEIARSFGCKLWLGDARKTTMLDIAENEYLIKDLINLISETKVEKIARILNENDLEQPDFFAMKFQVEAGQSEEIHFTTEVFTSEDEARKWLLG
jgi:hypothetical protein